MNLKCFLFNGIFFTLALLNISAIAQVPPHGWSKGDIKVINITTVKKGDTCIGLTGMSLSECIEFGRSYGRRPKQMDEKKKFDVPLFEGETIAFVRYTEDGVTRVRYILHVGPK